MDGVTVRKLARDLHLPVSRLMSHLKEIGVSVENEDDLVTGNQQLLLLQRLRDVNEGKLEQKEVTLDAIKNASDLRELNQLLTQSMAERKIQALIAQGFERMHPCFHVGVDPPFFHRGAGAKQRKRRQVNHAAEIGHLLDWGQQLADGEMVVPISTVSRG